MFAKLTLYKATVQFNEVKTWGQKRKKSSI